MAGKSGKCTKLASIIFCLVLPIILIGCGGGGGGSSSNSNGDTTDTTAPTVPANLTAVGVSTSQIDLSWTASVDNVGVAGYKIYRDGSFLETVTFPSTSDTGLGTATRHCYTISAYDTTGNESAQSGQVCAETLWALATVDWAADVGTYSSIAIDSANGVHISYQGRGGSSAFSCVGYATKTAATWSTGDFNMGGSDETISWTRLAIDANNNAHIVYRDTGMFVNSLEYVTDESGTWATTPVANAGSNAAIAADPGGTVHVSYHDETNGGLMYATNVTGSFVTSTVDASHTAGLYTSLALGSNGKVHISYHDAGGNGYLKYATNASGAWVTSIVDNTGYVGAYSSIALDSNDKVHISYYDNTNGDLKYATNASGSWVTSTIDSTGYVGLWTSIALDSNNNVHISYYDATNGDLKYATNASGDWVISTVDSTGDVGSYSSLAIDSNGIVRISYYDTTNGDLKYATNE